MTRRDERVVWVDKARHALKPGEKQPCVVCGQHATVAHAHHLAPLSLQWDAGIREPIQDFVWVCPTHHAIVHVLLGCALDGGSNDVEPWDDRAACAELAGRGLGLMVRALAGNDEDTDEPL